MMELILGLIMLCVMFLCSPKTDSSVNQPVKKEVVISYNKNMRNIIADKIKNDIIQLYSDTEIDNKRDRLVQQLRRLHMYEDPGDFLDNHNYIHDYIFNYYLHT